MRRLTRSPLAVAVAFWGCLATLLALTPPVRAAKGMFFPDFDAIDARSFPVARTLYCFTGPAMDTLAAVTHMAGRVVAGNAGAFVGIALYANGDNASYYLRGSAAADAAVTVTATGTAFDIAEGDMLSGCACSTSVSPLTFGFVKDTVNGSVARQAQLLNTSSPYAVVGAGDADHLCDTSGVPPPTRGPLTPANSPVIPLLWLETS